MNEGEADRLESLYAELCEGAKALGEPAPAREDVARLAALLQAEVGAVAVPADLVPSLQAALAEAARPQVTISMGSAGPRALLRLLWAEARFLPVAFLACQAALLAMAFAANRYLTGFAGTRLASAGSGGGAALDLVFRAILRDALGRSVDAFSLITPWLGLAVALFAALPRRRGLWADLEALSPFGGPARLLARAAVATLVTVAATAVAGLAQMGPAPATLLLLARTAPLFLAVAWALVWSVPFGAPGGVLASLALWGGLVLAGGGLGRWDLFAPPGAATPARLVALVAAAALLAAVWVLASRRARPVYRPQGHYGS